MRIVVLTVQKFVDLLCLLSVKRLIGLRAAVIWGDMPKVYLFVMLILCVLVLLKSDKIKGYIPLNIYTFTTISR